MQLRERRRRRVRQLDARFGQDEVEVGPSALLVVGGLNGLAGVEPLLGARLGVREDTVGHVNTMPGKRLADADPVRKYEHAARVQKHRSYRHHFSLHLEG